MPQLRPQVIDGLWLHLCPSFSPHNFARSLPRVSKLPNRSRSRNFLPQRCSFSSSSRLSLVTIIPSHPKNPDFWKPKHLEGHNKESLLGAGTRGRIRARFGQQNGQPVQPFEIDDETRKLSNLELHTILQSQSENACYKPVYDIVELLVGERGETPSRAHYLALITVQANLEHGSAAEVERLLQEAENNDVELDAGLCSAVLKALAVHSHYMLRCWIIDEMERAWTTLSGADYHHIAAGMLRDRQFELAWDQLGIMQSKGFYPEPWLLNLFLFSLSSISAWHEVSTILTNLPSERQFNLPVSLWYHLLHAATREHHQPLVSAIWNRAVKTGFINPSSGLCTAILESCAANGDTTTAADVFRVLSQRPSLLQSWHYESLLEAYIVSNDLEGILSAVHIMTKAGFPLSKRNSRSLYHHLQENLEVIPTMLELISSAPVGTYGSISLVLINTVMEALISRGNLSAAMDVFDDLVKYTTASATVATFNILLQGCADASQKDAATSLAREMLQQGILPTASTYDCLILACLSTKTQGGLIDAWRYYDELVTSEQANTATEAEFWGLRRGTIRMMVLRCVPFQDRRAFDLLRRFSDSGVDIDNLLEPLEREWKKSWGWSSLGSSEDKIASTSFQVESSTNNSSMPSTLNS